MPRKRVFLAGEGRTELGGWTDEPPCRDPAKPGAIEHLLAKAGAEADVVGAVSWKHIRKFRAGGHASSEERNVRGAALKAREAGAEVLVLCRDSDGDPHREQQIRKGIEAAMAYPAHLRVAGGCAVRRINDWVRELVGKEPSAKAEDLIEALDACEMAALDHARSKSSSLDAWLESIEAAWS